MSDSDGETQHENEAVREPPIDANQFDLNEFDDNEEVFFRFTLFLTLMLRLSTYHILV